MAPKMKIVKGPRYEAEPITPEAKIVKGPRYEAEPITPKPSTSPQSRSRPKQRIFNPQFEHRELVASPQAYQSSVTANRCPINDSPYPHQAISNVSTSQFPICPSSIPMRHSMMSQPASSDEDMSEYPSRDRRSIDLVQWRPDNTDANNVDGLKGSSNSLLREKQAAPEVEKNNRLYHQPRSSTTSFLRMPELIPIDAIRQNLRLDTRGLQDFINEKMQIIHSNKNVTPSGPMGEVLAFYIGILGLMHRRCPPDHRPRYMGLNPFNPCQWVLLADDIFIKRVFEFQTKMEKDKDKTDSSGNLQLYIIQWINEHETGLQWDMAMYSFDCLGSFIDVDDPHTWKDYFDVGQPGLVIAQVIASIPCAHFLPTFIEQGEDDFKLNPPRASLATYCSQHDELRHVRAEMVMVLEVKSTFYRRAFHATVTYPQLKMARYLFSHKQTAKIRMGFLLVKHIPYPEHLTDYDVDQQYLRAEYNVIPLEDIVLPPACVKVDFRWDLDSYFGYPTFRVSAVDGLSLI